ncbi:MAG TPA: GNAT family N-acetyltransferase [Anaerolineae bacterium]|nr:GNAT family N-acetyltransferase [Anaerolineae bacterium]
MAVHTIIIETPRLTLRRFIMDDLESLFALYGDPDVIKHIPDAPRNLEETKKELEWHMNGHPKFPELGLWATIHKGSGDFIGRCGLLPWSLDGQDEVEVAFALSKRYWGQGLATEAAQGIVQYAYETLKFHRLVCLIEEGNQASVNVAAKVGMSFERKGQDEIGPFLLYSLKL